MLKTKKWLAVLACLVFICAAVAALVGFMPQLKDRHTYKTACELLDSGNFAEARECFSTLDYADSADKVKECDYAWALKLMNDKEYETACSVFTSLADFRDSAEQLMQCSYLYACEWMDRGEYLRAVEAFVSLGDYADSVLLTEQCRESLYAAAMQNMVNSEFEAAAVTFEQLGAFLDSETQLKNCSERIAAEQAFTGNRVINDYNLITEFRNGKLYANTLGYIFVPDTVNADTAWLVYYPGGAGQGDNLSKECIWLEHVTFTPNAVMIYLFNNGWFDMRTFMLSVLDLMKQVALECDIWFHDVVTVGSSHGCFASIIAAPAFYSSTGITVDAVVAFDPGNEWDVPEYALLTEDECDTLAQIGTRVYLFEQHNFTDYVMTVAPVAEMIEHGGDIIVVECKNDGHNHIGPDAIRAGVYEWAMGQRDTLETDIYNTPYEIHMTKVYPDGRLENVDALFQAEER